MDSSAGTFGCGHIGNGDSILEYATSASVRCAWNCSSIVALSTPGKRYAKAFPDSSERNCLMFCVRLSVIRSFNLWMAKIITSLYNCNSFIPARRETQPRRDRPHKRRDLGRRTFTPSARSRSDFSCSKYTQTSRWNVTDPSGSVYSYQECHETILPEGTYIVQYRLGGTYRTGKNIAVKISNTIKHLPCPTKKGEEQGMLS